MVWGTIASGFLAGVGATLPMILTEYPAWRRWGLTGVLEWHENQAVAARFLNRPEEALVLPGLFLHLLHGGLAGVVFFVALHFLGIRSAALALGPLFGVLLWAVTLVIHQPLTRVPPWNHPQGRRPVLLSLLGHLVYGTTLGLVGGVL